MAKYDSSTKEGKCIFCEISHGRVEPMGGGTIWDSENYMAWLSPFPNTEGFAVVIPKKHFGSDLLTMPDIDLCGLVIESKKVADLLTRFFEDVGRVGLIVEGLGVDHAHIKLFPMHGTGEMKRSGWRQISSTDQRYFETYPGFVISSDGPKADFPKLSNLARRIREFRDRRC
jgi:histidine triad (HIT) family protein